MAKRIDSTPKNDDAWMTSYSDVVTSLLAFFVLIVAISTIDQRKVEYIQESIQEEVLKKQLASAFNDVDRNSNLIVAYEPVWAIGTGKSATSNQVDKTHRFINEILNEFFETLPQILYGGSVNAENAAELFEIKNVDGFLVGGASLNSENFCQIIKNIT